MENTANFYYLFIISKFFIIFVQYLKPIEIFKRIYLILEWVLEKEKKSGVQDISSANSTNRKIYLRSFYKSNKMFYLFVHLSGSIHTFRM